MTFKFSKAQPRVYFNYAKTMYKDQPHTYTKFAFSLSKFTPEDVNKAIEEYKKKNNT